MSITRVVCPHCSQPLQTAQHVVVGQRLLCPGCRQPFAFHPQHRADLPLPAAIHAAPPPLPVAVAAPIPHARKLPWMRIALGGLLLLAIGTGLVLCFRGGSRHSGPEQTADRAPAPSETTGVTKSTSSPALPESSKPSEPPWLPADRQARVDAAIDRGVAWFLKHQSPDGIWVGPGDHPVAMAALPALTLLECGLPADMAQVRRAVQRVRDGVPRLDCTYDLALAVLFLDRLHEAEDRPRIRSMLLRLAAGQQVNGGWEYHCPVLDTEEEQGLLTALEKTRPASPLDLLVQGGSPLELGLFVTAGEGADASGGKARLKRFVPTPGEYPGISKDRPRELTEEERKRLVNALPPRLRSVPALHPPAAFDAGAGDADNSNTQFAILALLVAPRYDVALEATLGLVSQRFHAMQREDGNWTYSRARPTPPRPSMTGAGLLDLAVKYGLVLRGSRADGRAVTIRDPAIDKGLKALGEYIGRPLLWMRPRDGRTDQDRLNLYAMWSIERVGALYHLRRINGKEWYPWGVDLLLSWQEDDGHWRVGHYFEASGATDTCFALLFLRRADFARDLSHKLEFFAEGKGVADHN